MTQEEKELLFKDLCARLPYGVKVQPSGSASPHRFVGYDKSLVRIDTGQRFELKNIKPYLRPMSSMTEEEIEELNNLVGKELEDSEPCFIYEQLTVDFYLRHHLDNRLMIKKGLALEASEGMYE